MNASPDGQFVVDCEYSATTNELISMAIVPLWPRGALLSEVSVPSLEFYEVISPLPENMSEWVVTNVVPHLGKPGVTFQQFQEKLEAFLLEHRVEELHYDWCEDISYFNRAMITGPGERIKIPGKFISHIHHPNIEYQSKVAHSALHDARAIAAMIRQRIIGIRTDSSI